MFLVDQQKSCSGECYYPYSALTELGATCNFISQAIADCLAMEGAIKRKPPLIATIKSETLCNTAILCKMVHMPDSAGNNGGEAINLIVADISDYNIMLSMS